MNRLRTIVTLVIPSILVGGLAFHGVSGNAAADPDRDLWGSPSDRPPTPPTPPRPPKVFQGRPGVSVSINGDHIQITGIEELVGEHLDAVREMLRRNPNVPKDVRDKITARMDRVRSVVDKRLKNLKTTDLDRIGEEMDQLGAELEQALEGLDKDVGKLGDKLAKQINKDLKRKLKLGPRIDDDDRDTDVDSDDDRDDVDTDDGRADDEVQIDLDDFKSFTLEPAQRDAIARLHQESASREAAARRALDDASQRLETALADARTSDAEVVRLVDQVTIHEAEIRKVKLLTWMQVRRVLDADQVRKLERVHRR